MIINKINIQLNKYIKKYYLFKTLKGILNFILISTLLYFTAIFFNYFFYFSTLTKTFLFWSTIITIIILLALLILSPLARYFQILKPISQKEASFYISSFYSEIRDKLKNIIELNNSESNSPLVIASIEQKYNEIKFFNFSKAVDFTFLLKKLKYLAIPVVIYLLAFLLNSNFLSQGFFRFSNYSSYYSQPLPFKLILKNKDLTVQEGETYKILVEIAGKQIPNNVFVNFGSNSIIMSKKDNNKRILFYDLKSVTSNLHFYFEAEGYKSKIYTLNVIPTPKILNFSLKVVPPKYTKIKQFTTTSSGDILVPFGTKLFYHFKTNSADSLFFVSDSLLYNSTKKHDNFYLNLMAQNSIKYDVFAVNKFVKKKYFTFNLNVVPDLFPTIKISTLVDSINFSKYYFYGKINDDYGFSSLYFNYQVVNKSSKTVSKKFLRLKIPFNKNTENQEFYYAFDFSDLKINSSQKVNYYFSIYDNDVINNFKITKSALNSYQLKSLKEIDSNIERINVKIESKLLRASELSFDLQEDIKTFNEKLLNENLSEWEKKEFIDNILQKQYMLKQLIDSLQKENSNKINNLMNSENINENLLKKQKEIQDLLDKILTPEMLDLLNEFKKLKQDFNQKKLENTLKKSVTNYKKLNQDLDRSKELLKRMRVEQQLNSKINEFKKLSEDYKNMAQSISQKKKITDEIKDSIAISNYNIENLFSDYDSLLSFNNKLIKPYKLDSLNTQQNELNKDKQNIQKSVSNNKQKQTKKNLNKTSDDLKKLANKLNKTLASNNLKSKGEDVQTIKNLLSNLLSFSFDQEEIYNQTKTNISIFSPKYKDLKIQQLNISNDFKIITDSLLTLAKRNPSISKIITDEIFKVNSNLKKINVNYLNANKKSVILFQRKILLSVNKVSLLLNESLQNMQNQNSSGNGNQKSNNKKNGSGLSDLKSFQEGMKQNLEKMIQQMKDGKQPSSQQLGMQLAKREAFQKMLDEYMNNNQISDELKAIMNQTIKLNEQIKHDIINNNMNSETIKRDKLITTHLLESEKANNKRKFSDKRKSNSSLNLYHEVPNNVKNSFKSNSNFNEIFTINNLFLNKFFKQYYNDYTIRLRNKCF